MHDFELHQINRENGQRLVKSQFVSLATPVGVSHYDLWLYGLIANCCSFIAVGLQRLLLSMLTLVCCLGLLKCLTK